MHLKEIVLDVDDSGTWKRERTIRWRTCNLAFDQEGTQIDAVRSAYSIQP